MIQLTVLSGKKAGAEYVARRFPFQIGRAPGQGLGLEEDGVWDEHAAIDLDAENHFVLKGRAEAFLAVNGRSAKQEPLRNGDILEVGSVKIRFSLLPASARSWRLREILTWIGLGLLALGEIGLIYWLLE